MDNQSYTVGCALSRTLWLMVFLVIGGCAELAYYRQALSGHSQLMRLSRPVSEVIADPTTPSVLRQRLETVQALRDFASSELALPDNRSYRSYADLQRSFAVWNVFAAPELSLELKEWCFPIVGCVSYRGYFDAAAAQALANELRDQGYDVYVAGIPAYSTLGWFDDPLLNTFISWPIGRLAELLFHELAHQRLYIADDSTFNESFATAVGRLGTQLWLQRHGAGDEYRAYRQDIRRQEDFLILAWQARDALISLYQSDESEAAKREGKRRILDELQLRYRELKRSWRDGHNEYNDWFVHDINNAMLAALNTYTRYVPAFDALFEHSGRDFETFYQTVEAIGRLAPELREARLQALMVADAGD